jgi:hypothetical protein
MMSEFLIDESVSWWKTLCYKLNVQNRFFKKYPENGFYLFSIKFHVQNSKNYGLASGCK